MIFREYVLKIAFTRSIFQPKIQQIAFGGRAPLGPADGELMRSPDPLAAIWGLQLRGGGE